MWWERHWVQSPQLDLFWTSPCIILHVCRVSILSKYTNKFNEKWTAPLNEGTNYDLSATHSLLEAIFEGWLPGKTWMYHYWTWISSTKHHLKPYKKNPVQNHHYLCSAKMKQAIRLYNLISSDWQLVADSYIRSEW